MAQTSSLALDDMSLQRWVEGKGLQPFGVSSRAACGQDTFTQLHALVWQRSWGEGHLDALGEKPDCSSPSPCVAVMCCRLSTAETGAQQGPSLGPWTAQSRLFSAPTALLISPQLPQTSPSHLPAPQPAPLPKLRQPFLHVPSKVHRWQSSEAKPPSISPPLGAALHTTCSCAHHATCECAHRFNRNSNNVPLLSFWGLRGSDESLEVPGDNRTAL